MTNEIDLTGATIQINGEEVYIPVSTDAQTDGRVTLGGELSFSGTLTLSNITRIGEQMNKLLVLHYYYIAAVKWFIIYTRLNYGNSLSNSFNSAAHKIGYNKYLNDCPYCQLYIKMKYKPCKSCPLHKAGQNCITRKNSWYQKVIGNTSYLVTVNAARKLYKFTRAEFKRMRGQNGKN